MQVCRARVTRVHPAAGSWPHDLLDIVAGDVLVVYDIRRYENATLRLAEIAAQKGVEVVLITDQWRSPIERHATHTFSCRIEAPSAWDSSVALLLLTEILIASAQERLWDGTESADARARADLRPEPHLPEVHLRGRRGPALRLGARPPLVASRH